MFAKLFGKKTTEIAQKFSGRTDFLEAVCAAAALIAIADGEIEDSEIQATTKAIKANKALEGFDAMTIEKTMNTMFERATGGRVGQMNLRKELADIAKDAEMAEAVLLTALDVAEGDGEIEPKEKEVLEKMATSFGLKLSNYL